MFTFSATDIYAVKWEKETQIFKKNLLPFQKFGGNRKKLKFEKINLLAKHFYFRFKFDGNRKK